MMGTLIVFMAGLSVVFFEILGPLLAVSSMLVLLKAELILYESNNIIHGGETNYIMATVALYISIFNLFANLLHLMGLMKGEERGFV